MGMPDQYLARVEDQEFMNRDRMNRSLQKVKRTGVSPIGDCLRFDAALRTHRLMNIQTDSLYSSKFC
jgi:hypothetical protein